MKKVMATLITDDVKRNLETIAEYRHKAHTASFNASKRVYESILATLSKTIYEINLPGIEPVEYDIKDLLNYFDTKDYDNFVYEKEMFNIAIEKFLKEIDMKFGTKYCPTGALRNDFNVIPIREGQIYWVKREANGLFSTDGKHDAIPALVISKNDWNMSHGNYQFLSVMQDGKMDEYTVKFDMLGSEHMIRGSNSFTARRIHIGDYIATVDESILTQARKKHCEFFGMELHYSTQEEKLEDIIERIIREKSEQIRRETVRQSVENGMDIITKKLEQMYPNHIEPEIIKEIKEPEPTKITKKVTEKNKCKKESCRKYEKWDAEKAKKFLDAYNTATNKKELAKSYNFTNMSSLYTRKQRCMELLGLA